jgi:hypothetical protein
MGGMKESQVKLLNNISFEWIAQEHEVDDG